MEIKVGADGRDDIITTYDRDLGALDCGCDGARSVERTAGGITLTSIAKTDSAGRPSERTDENGYTTTFSYVDDRRITTETMPSGATRITENYLDGRVKSITGTGVIPEYYSYTVNPDGTQTTRVETATQGSPRYREMTYDLAGRMIREESPASTGGSFATPSTERRHSCRRLTATRPPVASRPSPTAPTPSPTPTDRTAICLHRSPHRSILSISLMKQTATS